MGCGLNAFALDRGNYEVESQRKIRYTHDKMGGENMPQVKERSASIHELRKIGIPIMRPKEIFKGWPKPSRKVSLNEVHKRLSKFKGSLAEIVSKMRDENV